MTRRVSILAYTLVIALVLLGLQNWSIAVGHIERHVIAGIEDRTGLKVTALERAEIAILPLPRVSLSHVSFTKADGTLAGKALRLKAHARLLPLLFGRLSFERIDLVVPEIDVALIGPDEGPSSWLATPLAYLTSLQNQSRIVITSGTIFARADGAIRTTLRDVNLVVDEREPSEPIVIAGTVNWRGVPTEIGATWPVAGERARVSLSAASELASLRLEGTRSGGGEPVINGQVTIATRSLSELLGWFGEKPRLAAAINRFDLSAEAQIKPNEISLSNASLSLDGDRLDGALALGEAGSRWALSGTLAGAALDLGRLYDRLDLPRAEPAGGKTTPLEFDAWTAHDIDLRVSVDAARISGARLTDVATQLLVKKGRFEAGLLRASAYGGTAKARLLAVSAPGGIDVKLQAGFDRINLAQGAADMPDFPRLSGTGNLQLALEGSGTTAEDVVASLAGKANVALRQGELGGFAFLDLLRRAERNPVAALREWRQGKTPFESLSASATISSGMVTIGDGQMSGPVYKLTLAGQSSLSERWIEMNGQLAPANGAYQIPLALKGALDNPSLTPNTDALLSPTNSLPASLLR
ncbi:AsmA family protein [Bosea caraganae]|uniref:AsmA family protein n=1 Tax=Bosea caraganae TaxID=2763117 RepID=A0A370LCN4_9HYPH|nr:AsmA-like C-terminal region-containing protein [Bosea caraganae]RDJ27668.1 AsmA family protein [Bosea caraganae]RDJ29681.1 AsmA family protein [Bosea caraganae]